MNAMKLPTLESLSQSVQQVLPKTRAAWVFGSFVRGQIRADSDIDLAIDFLDTDEMQRLLAKQQLASMFGRDVDLLDFKKAPTVMQYQILATGQELFSRDPVRTLNYNTFVQSEYQKIQRWRKPMIQEISKRLMKADHG
jgi:uncharacterized protein